MFVLFLLLLLGSCFCRHFRFVVVLVVIDVVVVDS